MPRPGFYYKLVDGKAVETSVDEVEEMFKTRSNILKKTAFPNGVEVSTVFLGINHSFDRSDLPVLFETMVFGGKYDGWQERSSSQEEILKIHETLCTMIREDAELLRKKVFSKKSFDSMARIKK